MSIVQSLPVILCIGSASVAGDRLGPIVGDILRNEYNIRAFVYGGLKNPVNGVNYVNYLSHIKEKHQNNLIIAVDACVGDKKDIGKIKLTTDGVRAGGALNKNLERAGHIGVLGVVAERGKDNLNQLMQVPPQKVNLISRNAAEKVAGIVNIFFKAQQKFTENTHYN